MVTRGFVLYAAVFRCSGRICSLKFMECRIVGLVRILSNLLALATIFCE